MKTMSRHTFPGHAGQTVNIGWDRPLATFFVQITRPHPTHKGDDEIVEWRGTDDGELPAELGATLETDRMKTLGQTDGPAQMAARRFRHNDSQ
jgi:hypothetical protein